MQYSQQCSTYTRVVAPAIIAYHNFNFVFKITHLVFQYQQELVCFSRDHLAFFILTTLLFFLNFYLHCKVTIWIYSYPNRIFKPRYKQNWKKIRCLYTCIYILPKSIPTHTLNFITLNIGNFELQTSCPNCIGVCVNFLPTKVLTR